MFNKRTHNSAKMKSVLKTAAHPVEEVSGLDELWAQWMLCPMNPEVSSESFRQEVVTLHNLIQHLVNLNGRFDVSLQDLNMQHQNQ